MMISNPIIEEGLTVTHPKKTRETVRAIITNEQNELLMLYSKIFNDYTFPGGGVKYHETDEEALKRELKEELGAEEITIHGYLGFIEEIRYGLNDNDHVYLQTSRYYMVSVHKFGETHLMGREQLHGLSPKWINSEDAILHNENVKNDDKHQKKGLRTVLLRECEVLKTLRRYITHEKI